MSNSLPPDGPEPGGGASERELASAGGGMRSMVEDGRRAGAGAAGPARGRVGLLPPRPRRHGVQHPRRRRRQQRLQHLPRVQVSVSISSSDPIPRIARVISRWFGMLIRRCTFCSQLLPGRIDPGVAVHHGAGRARRRPAHLRPGLHRGEEDVGVC
jgi:hypothetical protein